jgi:hypothetical protein
VARHCNNTGITLFQAIGMEIVARTKGRRIGVAAQRRAGRPTQPRGTYQLHSERAVFVGCVQERRPELFDFCPQRLLLGSHRSHQQQRRIEVGRRVHPSTLQPNHPATVNVYVSVSVPAGERGPPADGCSDCSLTTLGRQTGQYWPLGRHTTA